MPDTAFAQGSIRTDIEIDHSSTGFPLSGGHAQVVCERCHLQGIFRGTPTQCMQCHSPGGRVVSTFKPTNHLPTMVNCSSCHRTTNWTPAFFTHNGVAPGTCSKCHNQSYRGRQVCDSYSDDHELRQLPPDGWLDWCGLQTYGGWARYLCNLSQRYPGSGEVGRARVYSCFVRFLPSSGRGELAACVQRI